MMPGVLWRTRPPAGPPGDWRCCDQRERSGAVDEMKAGAAAERWNVDILDF